MTKPSADEQTRRVFAREQVPDFVPDLRQAAWKKLAILHAVGSLQDLRAPPGNRLEKKIGRGMGQYRIRINDPWRICLEWRAGDAHAVEIADYRQGGW